MLTRAFGSTRFFKRAVGNVSGRRLLPSTSFSRNNISAFHSGHSHNHFGWPAVEGHDTKLRATTICSILKDGKLAIVGDGQVSMGPTIAKPNAKKVRRVASGKSEILVGFAGGTADAMSLLDRLEKSWTSIQANLQEHVWNWQKTGALKSICDTYRQP